eukprot:1149498-Pelagomonas_calceolata.AAC.8
MPFFLPPPIFLAGIQSTSPHTAPHITLSAPVCRVHKQLSIGLLRSWNSARMGKGNGGGANIHEWRFGVRLSKLCPPHLDASGA